MFKRGSGEGLKLSQKTSSLRDVKGEFDPWRSLLEGIVLGVLIVWVSMPIKGLVTPHMIIPSPIEIWRAAILFLVLVGIACVIGGITKDVILKKSSGSSWQDIHIRGVRIPLPASKLLFLGFSVLIVAAIITAILLPSILS
ncbi:hypothetical protein AKJ42_01780 [candidate division MSBL1 archaeon SCGC-AAA261C02]|uniref:Uncharacterized protein n=1 Tax=candidate division MSBL1 archaeon SCGC-AAA261C02 TaxID=1698272 RepID=A0A133V0Y1_9EURY|nr:hypothetical protein AKJ42_01780 [candidate division MSBL1 archaeon SCGC-AAA261C02]